MRGIRGGCWVWMACRCMACVEYTPKPRGYVRIEPEVVAYEPLDLPELPFLFEVSQAATVELPDSEATLPMFNLSYPSLHAKVYCSYLPITPASYTEVESESRRLVARLSAGALDRIQEKAYAHPEERVFGSLFLIEGNVASPIQFLLTDSVSHFLRGALYFDCHPNADSLAPAIHYLRQDVVELMQTFQWRR